MTLRFLKLFSWGPANRPPPPKALQHPVIFAKPIRNSGGSRAHDATPLTLPTAGAAAGLRPVIALLPQQVLGPIIDRVADLLGVDFSAGRRDA